LTLARELHTARLLKKACISESAQCYHFDFVLEDLDSFPFISGQFISAVAPDVNGKQQTRAYSIASAANENRFELCVNRVPEGFFSNHLADLTDLPPGGSIRVHGPHGHFVLKQPITDSIFISTGALWRPPTNLRSLTTCSIGRSNPRPTALAPSRTLTSTSS